MQQMTYQSSVEKWGMQEIVCKGTSTGNPFTERQIRGCFQGAQETVWVDGFYDGDGVYKVRFMPSFEGEYTFRVEGNYGNEVAVCESARLQDFNLSGMDKVGGENGHRLPRTITARCVWRIRTILLTRMASRIIPSVRPAMSGICSQMNGLPRPYRR